MKEATFGVSWDQVPSLMTDNVHKGVTYFQKNVAFGGIFLPSALLHVRGLGTSGLNEVLVTNGASTPVTIFNIKDSGVFTLGYSAANFNESNTVIGYGATATNGATNVTLIGRAATATANGFFDTALGYGATINGAGVSTAIGYQCATAGYGNPMVHAYGSNATAGAAGAWMFGSNYGATFTNDIYQSFKWGANLNTNDANTKQGMFWNMKSNVLLNATVDVRSANVNTHMDTVAQNTLTVANGLNPGNITVSSVSANNTYGAVFNTASSLTNYILGDEVTLSGFTNYSNTLAYYAPLTATTFNLFSTRAAALAYVSGTAIQNNGNDTGTATASSRGPATGKAETVQYFVRDVSSSAVPHWMLESNDLIKLYKVSSGWSISNLSTDRSYDANATTLDELADVVGTLIEDLKNTGIITS